MKTKKGQLATHRSAAATNWHRYICGEVTPSHLGGERDTETERKWLGMTSIHVGIRQTAARTKVETIQA